jgi:hypothetical protein
MATSRNEARVILSAEDRSSAAFASFSKSLGSLSAGAATLRTGVAGLVAGLSVGALGNFARTAINAVDAINDVRDATGSTVENISALQDVARRTGTEVETVTSALIKFNGQLQNADPTKGPGLVLKQLGLEVSNLRQLDPAEALRQVAVALAGFADDGNKARAVQELFGKSVKDTGAFLKDLSTQLQLTATVTTEQAQAAEQFNKELFRLQANATDTARALLSGLIPALNRVFDDVRTFGDKVSLAGLAGEVRSLDKDLKELQSRKASAVFLPADIDKEINATAARLEAAKKKFNQAMGVASPRDALRRFENAERAGPAPTLRVPEAPSATPRAAAGARSARAEIIRPDLDLDAISAEFDRLFDQRDERARRAAQIYQQLLTPVEELAQKEAELDTLRRSGLISEETLGRARLAAAEEYADAMDRATGKTAEAVELVDELSQASLQAAERMQDALGDQLFNALDGRFDDIGDAFSNMIKRMVAESLSADIMNALFGAVRTSSTGVNSRGGGWLGDIGSAILGSFLPSFAGGGHTGYGPRSGGLDGQGGFFAMLHPRENVVDHAKGGGMAAPIINIYNTIGSVASQADVVAGMQQTRAQIMGELQRSRAYGGVAA